MRRYWIIKNKVKTTTYVENGYAAIGWSEVNFIQGDIEGTVDRIEKSYGKLSGRSKGCIERFLSVEKGDIVVVPCYKGFYLGIATGEYIHLDECVKPDDKANIQKTEFIKDKENKPICFKIEGKNTALATKIGSRHWLLEIRDARLAKYLDELVEKREDVSIDNVISNYEEREKDKLKETIREALSDYSKTWMAAKGLGFESLIAALFRAAGYETRILSKKIGGSGCADADVLAMRLSELDPRFNEVIYIQAKHHEGVTGNWGYEQINGFKKYINDAAKKNNGIVEIHDIDNNIIEIDPQGIKYALISSAKIAPRDLEEKEYDAENRGDRVLDDEIILIDGEMLSEMIVRNIDNLDFSVRAGLGLMKKFVHVDEFVSQKNE